MRILNDLNSQQKEAVLSEKKKICVIAGPGCGKTRTIIFRVIDLVLNKNVDPGNILLLTFSKKAIKEIKNRLIVSLGSRYSHFLNIYNFHSYCYRFLRKNYLALGFEKDNFPIYDRNDQEALIKKILNDKDYSYDAKEISTIILKISLCKIKLGYLDYTEKNDPVRYKIFQEYQKLMSLNNAFDFNDLLIYTAKILKNNQELKRSHQNKFTNILVDEFQDVNDLQWEIVNLFSGSETAVFLVGDPNQSIYGFQGSSPNLISLFVSKDDWTTYYLNTNYRSTGNIVNFSNSFLTRNRGDLILNQLKSTKEMGSSVKIISSSVRFIVKKIIYLIKDLQINPREIIILYRINYLSAIIEQELSLGGITYEVLGSFRFIEREEVKDVLSYLRLFSFKDDISFLRILRITESFGPKFIENVEYFSKKNELTISNYLNKNVDNLVNDSGDWKLNKNQKVNIENFISSFNVLNQKIKTNFDILNFVYDIINDFKYFEHLDKKNNSFERKKNIQQFFNIIKFWKKENCNFEVLEDALDDFIQYFLTTFEDSDANKSKNNLIISSVHQAKGLEFDFVFFLYLDNGIIPYKNSTDLAEEKRIFYVGITRAKKCLYLVSNNSAPSEFISNGSF
jgi:DNA helicase II / ATP-dependent DNA helicase PcrA